MVSLTHRLDDFREVCPLGKLRRETMVVSDVSVKPGRSLMFLNVTAHHVRRVAFNELFLCHFLDVCASRKGSIAASDYDSSNGIVSVQLARSDIDLADKGAVERI